MKVWFKSQFGCSWSSDPDANIPADSALTFLFGEDHLILATKDSFADADDRLFSAAQGRAGVIQVDPGSSRNNACPVREPILSVDWSLRNINRFPNEVRSEDLERQIGAARAFTHVRKQFWLRLIVLNYFMYPHTARQLSGLIEDVLFGVSIEFLRAG